MYRKRIRGSAAIEAAKRAREAERLARPLEPRAVDLPKLRRKLVITDYDFGEVVHTIELYRTNRVDCYRVVADGVEWKRRAGWSTILEGIRKSFIRVAAA